jgi:DNA primase
VAPPETSIRAGRRRVRISNPGKLLFPADGITKHDLASYYAEIAPAMVPHVRDRPLNLWRWNAGIDGELVVQQAIPRGAPEWVKRVTVPRRRGGTVCHAVGGEAATLVWLANQNCITPHAWTSRTDRLGRPDRLVFDLDPPDADAGSHFPAIRAGALALGALLAGYAIDSTGYGLHHVASQTLAREAGVAHAVANAALLPHTIAALARRAPGRIAALDSGLPAPAARAAVRLAAMADASRLRDHGLAESAIPELARLAAARPDLDNTPPRATEEELAELYRQAY